MGKDNKLQLELLEGKLQTIAQITQDLAETIQGDSLALLALLRTLERLHQEIRDSFFQDALPDNRQALYNLLRDIETSGGWPYIHRMKLQSLLKQLSTEIPSPLPYLAEELHPSKPTTTQE
jgi:hypothetical protein